MAFQGWIRQLLPARKPRRRRPLYGCRQTERLECKTLLTVFVVTTPLDLPDIGIGDGSAVAANGETSLRAAVQEANARPGPDMIIFPARHFALFGDVSVEPAVDEAPLSESLAVSDDLTIIGWGATAAMFEGLLNSRVFDVRDGVTLNLRRLTFHSARTVPAAASGGQAEIADVSDESVVDAPPTSESDDLPRDASSETAIADLSAVRARTANASAVSPHRGNLLAEIFSRQIFVADKQPPLVPRQFVVPQAGSPPDATLGITNPQPPGAESALRHEDGGPSRIARSADRKVDSEDQAAEQNQSGVVNSLFETVPAADNDNVQPARAVEPAEPPRREAVSEPVSNDVPVTHEMSQPLFPELEIPPVETELPVIRQAAPLLPDFESELPDIQVNEPATTQRRSAFLPVLLSSVLASAARYRSTARRRQDSRDCRVGNRWATRVEALI